VFQRRRDALAVYTFSRELSRQARLINAGLLNRLSVETEHSVRVKMLTRQSQTEARCFATWQDNNKFFELEKRIDSIREPPDKITI
jgi:hypothetical protein